MHRLIVAFLAAFDAAIAVAVGVAAILAPLTLVWVLGLGDTADWSALWPASASVWQFGHLVPLDISLSGEYLAATGIDEAAASFTLSLAPLAFATFTAIFAARSGVRASRADAWVTGVLVGTGVVAVLSTLVALSSQNPVAHAELWQAALFPTLVFAVPALIGAVVTEWREAGGGIVARIRDRVEALPGGWGPVPGVAGRAAAAAVVGLVGVGALAFAVAVLFGAGDVVALYQAANLDVLGAIAVTLAQFAYLPTFVVWSLAFVAGPGFGLGEGAAVSPSGTQVGVLPGVPILGAVPESTSTWLLLLGLLPIAVGAFAGWIARSRLLAAAGYVPPQRDRAARAGRERAERDAANSEPPVSVTPGHGGEARRAALDGLLAASAATADASGALAQTAESPGAPGADSAPVSPGPAPVSPGADSSAERTNRRAPVIHEPILPRLVVTVLVAGLSAAAVALLAVFASGSIGPGRLSAVGPEPGPLALAVGLEVLVGAGILLLASRRASADEPAPHDAPAPAATGVPIAATAPVASAVSAPVASAPAPRVTTTPEPPVASATAPPVAVPPVAPRDIAAAPTPDDTVTAPIPLPGADDDDRPSLD